MKKLLAIALLCSAPCTVALAQSSRYYGAAEYGTINMSGQGTYNSPSSLTVAGGYRYLNNVNLEAGFTMIGSTTADVPGVGRVSVNQSILSAVAIGYIPVNSTVTMFGKAGLGMHNGEINLLPDDLVYGFGAQFLVNPKVSLRVQYESLGRQKIPQANYKADLTRIAFGAMVNF